MTPSLRPGKHGVRRACAQGHSYRSNCFYGKLPPPACRELLVVSNPFFYTQNISKSVPESPPTRWMFTECVFVCLPQRCAYVAYEEETFMAQQTQICNKRLGCPWNYYFCCLLKGLYLFCSFSFTSINPPYAFDGCLFRVAFTFTCYSWSRNVRVSVLAMSPCCHKACQTHLL